MKRRRPTPTLRRGAASVTTPLLIVLAVSGVAWPRDARELYPVAPPPRSAIGDPRLVGLRATGFFDPLAERPDFSGLLPRAPDEIPAVPGGRRYFLVQFDRPVTAEARGLLAPLAPRIVGYVPNNALVVGMTPPASLAAIVATPGVRFAGPFVAGYKLAPGLHRLLLDHPAGADLLSIDVELFPGEATGPLLDAVSGRFPGTAVRAVFVEPGKRGRNSRLNFEVTGDALERAVGLFLHFPTVAYVRRLGRLELHNDNSVWIGQSYDRVNGAAEAGALDPKPLSSFPK